ncbi:heterodisulfide reductase-related iron-sulfur binding cluster [Methanothermobacter thermautotrophicus]|uniref:heterodisulfide reductase-related iron-sulfur binding cluster n=1 Tax=Methanothermobacter thermautotrophicus TaxID=145262 RepID=UPI00373AE35C
MLRCRRGLRSAQPDVSSAVASSRIQEAARTGADILCTSCPFCSLNLGARSMRVMDITDAPIGTYQEEKR